MQYKLELCFDRNLSLKAEYWSHYHQVAYVLIGDN